MNAASTLDGIERQIVAGDLAGARSSLRRLRPSRLERPLKARYASLARRAEMPLVALNVLAPLVHPTPGSAPQGTPQERIEYGFALAKLRLVGESMEVFGSVDPAAHPQALLGLVADHFMRWDYAAAIPLLRRYLAHSKTSAYERLVAEVNLAAALVATETHGETEALLARLLGAAEAERSENLRGTLVLLQTQAALSRNDLGTAKRHLAEARKLLEPRGGKHALLWCKWAAIVDLRENGTTERTAHAFATVEHAAREQEDWETARHLAAHWALATGDAVLLARVYHGTPHAAFRRWLDGRLRPEQRAFERYSWELGPMPSVDRDVEGLFATRPAPLASATLRALCADVFRPLRLVELHPSIYPGEDFDPVAGTERLKFALKSLRRALESSKSSVRVAATGDGYRLESHPSIRLWVPVEARAERPEDDATALATLRAMAGELTSTKVAEALGWSERTTRRFLARAVDQGLLLRTGEARATRYHFPLRRAG